MKKLNLVEAVSSMPNIIVASLMSRSDGREGRLTATLVRTPRSWALMRPLVVGIISAAVLLTTEALALVRSNFTPGDASAVILLQGISAGQSLDPDARSLFDRIAMPASAAPGGEGKMIKTLAGDFTMSCVARNFLPEDALCSFVVKKTERSLVISEEERAEIVLVGEEAQRFHEGLSGPNSPGRFHFVNRSGEILLDSTPTVTRFYYIRR